MSIVAFDNFSNMLCMLDLSPCKLIFDLLTLKVVSESHVTWATSVPILVFLNLSVLDLGPMYATDVRRASSLNAPYPRAGYNKRRTYVCMFYVCLKN